MPASSQPFIFDFREHGIYRHACPNCGGWISDERLLFKAPCKKCLREKDFREVKEQLKNNSGLSRLQVLELYESRMSEKKKKMIKQLIEEEKRLKDFEEFFEKATGGLRMWSAQRMWARRLLKKSSFSIIAPTGMGKTVFSLIASLYLVANSKGHGKEDQQSKAYLVFPTTPLLRQAEEKIRLFAENIGRKPCSSEEWGENCLRILCVHGRLSKEERERALEKLSKGDFDILMSTNAFMHKSFELLKNKGFKLIVMDDVDAVLRSGKAVRRLLEIIGVEGEFIDKALNLVKAQFKLGSLSGEERNKLEEEIRGLKEEVNNVRKKLDTILLVNSATGRPRGIYPKLFKVLLGFEAGSKPEAIRNIVDTYVEPSEGVEEELVKLVSILGNGILVFVPADKGVEYAEKITELLKSRGFKAEAFHSKKPLKILKAFENGEIDVLVGVATYYGVMVRGLDMPERVKYVVFTGVPRHKFSSTLEEPSPTDILRILLVLQHVVEGDRKNVIEKLAGRISRRIKAMSPAAVMRIKEDLARKLKGEEVEETPLLRDLLEAREIIVEELSRGETWRKISDLGDVGIIRENGKHFMLIPDSATYIQASGRASRLYPGGITKGLSIIIVDDKRLLNGLVKKLRWIYEDFAIKPLSQVNLNELVKQIEEERVKVAEILKKGITAVQQAADPVKTALMIVESPNKAKTIANFFGKPSVRVISNVLQAYEVTIGNYVLTIAATGGHVYDLVAYRDSDPPEAGGRKHLYGVIVGEKEFLPIYTDIKKCSNGHQFTEDPSEENGRLECPRCKLENKSSEVARKLDIVNALRELSKEVDVVLIATDPDSEGEKIAWDLRVLLEPYANEIRRVEFHEVTRRAILNAIREPRDFNLSLVESQIVRRIEDRWLGFSLSEKVQKYAWLKYCLEYLASRREESKSRCCKPNNNFSAGRVQTPVLEYIVSETERRKRREEWRYKLTIYVEDIGDFIYTTIPYKDAEELGVLKRVKNKKPTPVDIEVVAKDVEEVNPPPPFTTDTLIEEASRLLGFTATRTMELAQNLFEVGLITYHRTDSTRISDVGIAIARQYLEEKYGADSQLFFKPRTWGEGGAHEAIRPTRPIDAERLVDLMREGSLAFPVKLTRDHLRLYDLVFRRFMASQMKAARLEKLKFKVTIGERSYDVETYTGVVEKGYLDVYGNVKVVEASLKLEPGMKVRGEIHGGDVVKPPMLRFHDIVKWMKEQGIGRPSTYAKIIQTIIDRRYVIVSGKTKSLIPVTRGKYVLKFLEDYYSDIVSVETTRKLEEYMEKISLSDDRSEYLEILSEIYNEVVDKILENKEVNGKLEDMYKEMCLSGGLE